MEADFPALQQELVRSLTGNLEQVIGAFVAKAAHKFEASHRAAEALEARAALRLRQADDVHADTAAYVNQEVARLEARLGSVLVEGAEVSDDPLIQLQSAWRRAVALLDAQLAAKDDAHAVALREVEDRARADVARAEAAAAEAQRLVAEEETRRLEAEKDLATELERKEQLLALSRQEAAKANAMADSSAAGLEEAEKARLEAREESARAAYDLEALHGEIGRAVQAREEVEAAADEAARCAEARIGELENAVAERDAEINDVKEQMVRQEEELLAKIERVQQYVKERGAGALHAETMQAVARADVTKLQNELRRVSGDRDQMQQALLAAEDRATDVTARCDAKLAAQAASISQLEAKLKASENLTREQNWELLQQRDEEHNSKVGLERLREKDRSSALLRRKDQELQVASAQIKALKAKVGLEAKPFASEQGSAL